MSDTGLVRLLPIEQKPFEYVVLLDTKRVGYAYLTHPEDDIAGCSTVAKLVLQHKGSWRVYNAFGVCMEDDPATDKDSKLPMEIEPNSENGIQLLVSRDMPTTPSQSFAELVINTIRLVESEDLREGNGR